MRSAVHAAACTTGDDPVSRESYWPRSRLRSSGSSRFWMTWRSYTARPLVKSGWRETGHGAGVVAARVAAMADCCARQRGWTGRATVPATPAGRSASIPTRMAQAVGNLLNNAVKYTPCARTHHRSMPGGAENSSWISVTDTGPGIPPRRSSGRVFEPLSIAASASGAFPRDWASV